MEEREFNQHTIESLTDYYRSFIKKKQDTRYKVMLLHELQKFKLIQEAHSRNSYMATIGNQGLLLPYGVRVYFTTDMLFVDDIIILAQ